MIIRVANRMRQGGDVELMPYEWAAVVDALKRDRSLQPDGAVLATLITSQVVHSEMSRPVRVPLTNAQIALVEQVA